jgi:ribonuclease T
VLSRGPPGAGSPVRSLSEPAGLLASDHDLPRLAGDRRTWSGVSDETWISVDVETSGPTPSTGSLLSIGACLVEQPGEGIELLVRPDPAMPWSEEAEAVHGLGRDMLARDGLDPRDAMLALEAWLGSVVPAGSRAVFVALNAPFDWMFVADAAWRHLGRNPFGISALDIKALYLGRHLDEVGAWSETGRRSMLRRYPVSLPHTHHALDDAREQALLCQAIRDAAERPRP